MRHIFLVFIISAYISQLSAQDSIQKIPQTSNLSNDTGITPIRDPLLTAKDYLLYNNTSITLNNQFNEGYRTGAHNRLTGDFNYYSSSIGVPANFAYKLLFNQPLPQALIDRTDKGLKNMLKFEEALSSGINYERYLDKINATLIVGYHFREMLNVSGPKQAFETIFYGNARFEGDTANLSNIHFQFYDYNQLSIGIYKKIDYGSYQMDFGVSGSFLQVINNQDISTVNTSLYTAPYGEFVDINYNLTYNAALSGAPSFTNMAGAGASGDFHLGFMNRDKWKLSFDLSDIGIMTFRRTPVNYSGAKNVLFQGIVIPNLLQFSSQTFDTLNLDSAVRANLPSKTTNSYSEFIPFTVNAAFSKPLLHDRLVLTFGIQYRHIPNYYVYGYVKANYFIQSDMVISGSVAAGGYSLCDVGVQFSKTWKYFDLTLGTSNLIGLVLPGYYPGSGAYLRFGTTF